MSREADDSLGRAVRSVLDKHRQGDSGRWSEPAGRVATAALREAGFLGVGLPEEIGGEGGGVADAVAVVRAVTGGGWPSPAADALLVTGGLLAALDGAVALEPGLVVVVPATGRLDGRELSVCARDVAWAPWADAFLVVAPESASTSYVAVTPAARASLGDVSASLAGAPGSAVRLDRAPARAVATVEQSAPTLLGVVESCGALARAVQIVAALQQLRELCLHYVATRRQFGRPLVRFQAVQHNLALLAGEVAASEAALDEALDDVESVAALYGDPRLATAKIRTATAVGEVARLAHQLHGALGVTQEYELHRHSLAVLSWREEFGDERVWARRLADAALAAGDLWSWLADPPDRDTTRRSA